MWEVNGRGESRKMSAIRRGRSYYNYEVLSSNTVAILLSILGSFLLKNIIVQSGVETIVGIANLDSTGSGDL